MKYTLLISTVLISPLSLAQDADTIEPVAEQTPDVVAMAEEMAEILTHTADVLDGVTDKSSADLAATALAPLKERAQAIQAATSGMENMDPVTQEKVMNILLPLFSTLSERMEKILQRLEANDYYGSDALKSFMLEN